MSHLLSTTQAYTGLLPRYIYKQVGGAILGSVVAITLLQAIFAYINELQNLTASYTFYSALKYVGWFLPQNLYDAIPQGVIVGAVLGLGILANHSELVVIRASGISLGKIVSYILVPCVGLMLLSLMLVEFVIPLTNASAHSIHHENRNLGVSQVNGYFFKQPNMIGSIDNADANGNLKQITLWTFNKSGQLSGWLSAPTGIYCQTQCHAPAIDTIISSNEAEPNDLSRTNQGWELSDVSHYTLDANGNNQVSHLAKLTVAIPIQPNSIYLMTKNPTEMSLSQLWAYKDFMARQHERAFSYELLFWRKLLSPLVICSLVVLASAFMFGSLRQATLGSKIVLALLVGIVFGYVQDLLGYISITTRSEPLLFTVLPIVLCFIVGFYLLRQRG